MKVLLEILDDASQLLTALDKIGDLRPETRARLEVLLQNICGESTRLLREESAEAPAPAVAVSDAEPVVDPFENRCREWLMQRSLEALARPDYERALKYLSEGAEAFPQDVEFLNHLGLVHWELGDFERAADAYLRAMGAAMARVEGDADGGEPDWRDPANQDYMRAMEGRALCLCRVEAFDEALVLFDALANMNAIDYAGCRYMAGEIRHLRGDYSAAIEDYRMGPVEPASLYNLGLALYQNGDTEAAAATFIRAFISNIHVFHAFCAREADVESCVPGYLGGRDYALEFVRACGPIWGEASDALDFMERCYDHPLVQEYLVQCRADGGDSMLENASVDRGQLSWLQVLTDETSVEGLAETVMKRLYS